MRQQVAKVDEDGGEGVGFGAGGFDGDGGPAAATGEDFEAGLAGTLEEEGYAAVVAVGAGADVDGGLVVGVVC